LVFDADSTTEPAGDSAYTVSSDVNLVGASSIEALFGRNVQYVLDADDNVAYIADATATSKVVNGTVDAIAAGSVTVGDTSYTSLPDAELVVYVNGVKQTGIAGINADDEVTVILDAAGKAQAVLVKQWAAAFVADATVAKTSVNKARIDGKALNGSTGASVALGDSTQIFRNGKVATLADIQAGDVIYYTTYAAGSNTTLVEAYSNEVTGKLNSFSAVSGSDMIANIGGTNYTVVAGSQAVTEVTAANIGKEYTATLDKDGKVVKLVEVTAATSSDVVFVQKVDPNISRVINNEVVTGYTRVTVLHNGQQMTHFIAKDENGADVTTTPVAGDVGSFKKLSLNADGEVTSYASAGTVVTGTIVTDGVDATNKKITLDVAGVSQTYNVTNTSVLVSNPSDTTVTDELDAAVIGFDKFAAGQTVTLIQDANIANASAVVVTAGLDLVNGLTAVTGVYVSQQVDYISATESVYKVTLNVGGANQSYVTTSGLSFTGVGAGDLVTLKDDTAGDGEYDALGSVVTASAVASNTTVANGFDATVGTSTQTNVYTSGTKVYVVKYDATGRDAAVVGTISDFTNLFYADSSTVYSVKYVEGSADVAGYKVVTDIVIYLQK
jgi:hypothetical protein